MQAVLVMLGLIREKMVAEDELAPLLAPHLLQQDKVRVGMQPQGGTAYGRVLIGHNLGPAVFCEQVKFLLGGQTIVLAGLSVYLLQFDHMQIARSVHLQLIDLQIALFPHRQQDWLSGRCDSSVSLHLSLLGYYAQMRL
jgi:hypothetical protein